MTAPAIVLVATGPAEPGVTESLNSIASSLQVARRDLRVCLSYLDAAPRPEAVLRSLVDADVAEAVIVPLDLVSAAGHDPRLDAVAHSEHIRIAVSRPIGPEVSLLTVLDQRLRSSLSTSRVLELDGLVLSSARSGDVRGNALLARRARNFGSLAVGQAVGPWDWRMEYQASGYRFDEARNNVKLDGYALLNLYGAYRFERDWSVFARVNNLFDRDYVVADGYATPGVNVFVGIRYAPK